MAAKEHPIFQYMRDHGYLHVIDDYNEYLKRPNIKEARPTVRPKRAVQQAKPKILPSADNCPGLKNKRLCKSCRIILC